MGLFRRKRTKVEPWKPPEAGYDYHYELRLAGGGIGGPDGDRQMAIMLLDVGQPLDLVREPRNRHDPNAVAVYADGEKLGYVPAFKAEMTAGFLDKGRTVEARVLALEWYEDSRERDLRGVLMWLGFKR